MLPGLLIAKPLLLLPCVTGELPDASAESSANRYAAAPSNAAMIRNLSLDAATSKNPRNRHGCARVQTGGGGVASCLRPPHRNRCRCAQGYIARHKNTWRGRVRSGGEKTRRRYARGCD